MRTGTTAVLVLAAMSAVTIRASNVTRTERDMATPAGSNLKRRLAKTCPLLKHSTVQRLNLDRILFADNLALDLQARSEFTLLYG